VTRIALVVTLSLSAGCGSGVPVPPPARELVGPEEEPFIVRSADLDGDGIEEVAIASAPTQADPSGFVVTHRLRIFAERDGSWVEAVDGARGAPPGADAPRVMLGELGGASQTIDLLEVADVRPGGGKELVVAVATFGASAGPVALWIISGGRGRFRTEYYDVTERGGRASVNGRTVAFEFGVYRRRDPGCCPSRIERQTIGWDDAMGRVTVLDRERVTP
jgi:hypothetical protein